MWENVFQVIEVLLFCTKLFPVMIWPILLADAMGDDLGLGLFLVVFFFLSFFHFCYKKKTPKMYTNIWK